MPSRYISRDGGILADRFTDGPYIFQNVHTLGGAARHTAAHTALLRAAAKSLFGFDPEITADELRRRIARLTEACRMPSRVSVRAVVRLYPTGSIEIACDEPSIYAGYVLRSLRPDAICLRMAPPLPSLPTSAAEHTRLLADTMAHTRGARTAILTDGPTWDCAAIALRAIDQNGCLLPYCAEAVQLAVEGPAHLLGPAVVPLRGGMAGVYLATEGVAGRATLRCRMEGALDAEASVIIRRRES